MKKMAKNWYYMDFDTKKYIKIINWGLAKKIIWDKLISIKKIGKNLGVPTKLGQNLSKISKNWEKMGKMCIIFILAQKYT